MPKTDSPRRVSLWVLPLDSGGCGACTQQIYALLAPRYAAELRTQGISLAQSPRHADVVLVTGALSETAREPLRRVLDGVPQPRVLVAVGNCAIDGCRFRGSPVLLSDGAEALDVNVEIAGCPPNPQAILDAIAEAGQLLSASTQWEEGDEEEGEDEAEDELDEDEADEVEAGEDELDEDEAVVMKAPENKDETTAAEAEEDTDRDDERPSPGAGARGGAQ